MGAAPRRLDANRLPALERGNGVPGALLLPVSRLAANGVPALAAAFRCRDKLAFCAMPRPNWSRAGTPAILKEGPVRSSTICFTQLLNALHWRLADQDMTDTLDASLLIPTVMLAQICTINAV